MRNRTNAILSRAALAFGLIALLAGTAAAQEAVRLKLDPPGPRQFILDRAALISSPDANRIRQVCDRLLTEKATPIVVVTIESMARYGGEGMSIESFATVLFDQWRIGIEKLAGKTWNTGILLLVSRDDRKARIELGAGWHHDRDRQALRIMDEQIIPRFKQGDFSAGIVAGVEALDQMARGLELPRQYRPPSHYLGGAALAAMAVFTIVSLFRRGSSGWAWLFWGVVFSIIGTLLYTVFSHSGRSGGGGGFSGGSFGGGSSGGGGASGSW